MIRYKFSRELDVDFSKTLRAKVNAYFKENNINPKANHTMVLKTFLGLGAYSLIYFSIIYSGITNLFALYILWALLGLGQAFIGMSIMHDVVHGAYTKNKFLYAILQVPVILIGVEPLIWKIEHNYLHHNYTNIEGLDEDIHPRFVFRFSEDQPRKWFHRYQHLYATFFYGLMIIEWITTKDLIKVIKFRKEGHIKTNKEVILTVISILIKKSVFYLVFLIIPLKFIDLPASTIISMFIIMLVVSGIVLALIFQSSHVLSNCAYTKNNEFSSKESWHLHQMLTTSNFAQGNKLITFLLGSLNYQIEHHLFPDICHVHYPDISEIVRATANEYGIPYYSKNTIWSAISDHYNHMKNLGRNDKLEEVMSMT